MPIIYKIKKQNLYNFFFIILYKVTLDLSYFFLVSKIWAYARFDLDLNIFKLAESYILFSFVFILAPKTFKKLSSVFIWLMILLSYVPMLTIFAFMDQSRIYMYAVTSFWLLIFLLLKFPTVSLMRLRKSESKIVNYLIFIGLSVIVLLLIFKYLGLSFNFDIAKVYEIRKIYTDTKIPFGGYLFTWLSCVINPVFFALFLNKKKWIWVGIIIFSQILIFSSTGDKLVLFALPFVLMLMWIISRKNPLAWITVSLFGLILAGVFSYWLLDDIWILSLFTRRILLIPAQLSFFYYDFFSENGFTFLSQHHIFSNFIEYPYYLDPPHLIADFYFNKPEANANNGIYADAFMNFGFVGIILWAFVLTIILKLIDSFSKNKKMVITVAAIAIPVISLSNSSLLTNFLTHGLLLSLIILYLLPADKQEKMI
jgi:oligosaccharide repeat unit polymerase